MMETWLARPELQGKFGFKIRARPASGYAYYAVAELRGNLKMFRQFFAPNQTWMVDIQLCRQVTEGVFRLTQNLDAESFDRAPKGADLAT